MIHKIDVDQTHIKIHIQSMLQEMDKESLLALADDISVQEAVIQNVVKQITEGSTDAGSWGYKGPISDKPFTPLDVARRELAKSANDVAKEEIEKLEYELDRQKNATIKLLGVQSRLARIKHDLTNISNDTSSVTSMFEKAAIIHDTVMCVQREVALIESEIK